MNQGIGIWNIGCASFGGTMAEHLIERGNARRPASISGHISRLHSSIALVVYKSQNWTKGSSFKQSSPGR
ncbi:MAG: hypothetical protein QGG53_45900, partial [Planctomycetota bacterium]|nr:hypothetical protein [Planctomycetota bacterium]